MFEVNMWSTCICWVHVVRLSVMYLIGSQLSFTFSLQIERFAYIADLYLSYGLDVMIVGQQGTGKTSFVQNLIQSRVPVTKLQMSPTLSPNQLQDFILERVSHLERRGGQRMVGGGRGANKLASSMRTTFFLDDIHLGTSILGISFSIPYTLD